MPVRSRVMRPLCQPSSGMRQLRSARNQLPVSFSERNLEGRRADRAQIDLPVPKIRSLCVDPEEAGLRRESRIPGTRCRPILGAQRGEYADGRQRRYSDAPVRYRSFRSNRPRAFPGCPVEMQTSLGITDHDGGVSIPGIVVAGLCHFAGPCRGKASTRDCGPSGSRK